MTPPRKRRKSGRPDVACNSVAAAESACAELTGNGDFIAQTIAVWQPLTDRELTREGGRQIVENVSGFFRILQEWDRAERAAEKTKSPCRPKHSDVTLPIATKIDENAAEFALTVSR